MQEDVITVITSPVTTYKIYRMDPKMMTLLNLWENSILGMMVGKSVLTEHGYGTVEVVLRGEILLHGWEGHGHGLMLRLYSLLRSLRCERLLGEIFDEMVVLNG
jgi:hypothetical protein